MRCTGRGKKLRGTWRQREDQREPEELVQDLSLCIVLVTAGHDIRAGLNEISDADEQEKRNGITNLSEREKRHGRGTFDQHHGDGGMKLARCLTRHVASRYRA